MTTVPEPGPSLQGPEIAEALRTQRAAILELQTGGGGGGGSYPGSGTGIAGATDSGKAVLYDVAGRVPGLGFYGASSAVSPKSVTVDVDRITFIDDNGEGTEIRCLSASGGRSYTHNTDESGALNYATREWFLAMPHKIDVAGTSLTLSATHNGRVVNFTSASAVTVTVPATLPAGFQTTLVQGGTGQVTIVGSGVTLQSYGGLLKTAGQYARANVLNIDGVNGVFFNVAGTLVA